MPVVSTVVNRQIRNLATGTWESDEELPELAEIELGFQPSYVKIFNPTNGVCLEWFEGMPQDSGIKTGIGGGFELITEDAISVNDGGFTSGGTPSDLLVTDNELTFIAMG